MSHVVVLFLHLLGATVWTGGHLVLAVVVLPRALRARSITELMAFEQQFERVGIPALATQVVTGLWLASDLLPPALWFDPGSSVAHAILIKLALLLLTALLAVDARLRLIPRMNPQRLVDLALHVVPVTIISVLFVLAGVLLRYGGL